MTNAVVYRDIEISPNFGHFAQISHVISVHQSHDLASSLWQTAARSSLTNASAAAWLETQMQATPSCSVPDAEIAANLSMYSLTSMHPLSIAPFNSSPFHDVPEFNNSSPVAEFFKVTVKALYTYAVPIVCVLGIVGDVTSFCIFVFTSFRYQPCSQYLAALTFVDTLFLISQLINSLMTIFPELASAPGYCSIMVYLSYVCSFLSAWFVVLMMLERYLVVCHPFRAVAIKSRRKPVVLIIFLSLVSAVLYSHSFLTTTSQPCQIVSDYYHFVTIFTYIDSFLTFIVPFFSIVYLNLRIILTVRKFRLRHSLLHSSVYCSQMSNASNKTLSLAQVRTTKMLVWVSTVFLILYLPSYATKLYGMVLEKVRGDDMDHDTKLWLFIAQQLCQILYYVNFAVDFIVYVVASSNFRRNVSRCARNVISM